MNYDQYLDEEDEMDRVINDYKKLKRVVGNKRG